MEFKLSTITPVHIGNGRSYSGAEFLVKGGKIYKVDINRVFLSLNENEKENFIVSLEDPNFKLEEFLKEAPISEIGIYSCELKTDPPNEVYEHIKTNDMAYIPGSSIKGAFRTAILYNLVNENDLGQIDKILRLHFRKRRWEIQKFVDGFFSGLGRNASYTSFLKFLRITDTESTSKMSVYSVKPLKAEFNRWEWYRGKTRFLETIDFNQEVKGELDINYDPEIYKSLRLEEKEDYIGIGRILQFIFQFSDDLIEHETEFALKYGIGFLEEFYDELRSKNDITGPVMKLGQGSGFLSTTIGLKLKNLDPNLFDEVRRSFRRSYPHEFPKTRKLVLDEKVPLGWVKVNLK